MRKFSILSILCCLFLFIAKKTVAQLPGWTNLQAFTITNNAATEGINIQVPLIVNTQSFISANQMQADGSDIRFGSGCNSGTLYNYYIDTGINTASTRIWVQIDTLPASGSKTIYMYTGNGSATAVSTINIFNGPFSSTDQISGGSVSGTPNSQRGFRFSPNTDILVTEFGKKEPDGTTRDITLFDYTTQAIVKQLQVSGAAATYAYDSLPEKVWLTAGTEYVLEMFSNDTETYYYTTSSQVNNNLTYYDMRYCNNCTSISFPTQSLGNAQYGYPDFRFYTYNTLTPAPTYTTGTPTQAVAFAAQPQDTTACEGSSTVFSVAVTGTVTGYQWQENTGSGFNDISNGAPYSGADTAILSISTVTAGMNNYQYRCLVTDACGAVINSDTATLSVLSNAAATISITGSQTTICDGQTDSFSVTGITNGGSLPQYLWYINSDSVAGANGTLFTAATLADGDTVTCVMISSNSCASPIPAVSNDINITVNPLPATPVAGSNAPLCEGLTLDLTASSATNGVTYDWTGPNSFSTTTQNPSITNAAVANSGSYTVTATLNGCASLPASVSATVNPIPVISSSSSTDPASCSGSNGSITLNGLDTSSTYTVSYTKDNTPTTPVSISSDTDGTLVITNLSAGTYTDITVESAAGCTAVPVSTITLSDPGAPATPVAMADSAICAGLTLNLSTDTVSNMSYNWTGPNSFSSSLQNPAIASVTTAEAGMYILTVTDSTTGCTSAPDTVSVVVNTPPAAPTASSNSTICEGQTLDLTTPTVSGMSYNWTGPNSFNSSAQDPSISTTTTADAGSYSITLTDSTTGCTSAAGNTTVVITPAPATPTASSNGPLCPGQTLNLSTPAASGMLYNWTGPNSFISSSQNPAIFSTTSADSGIYSVTLTDTVTGCTSAAGMVTATINPLPATPVISVTGAVCEGYSLNLTTNTVPGATYTWTGPNSFSSALQNPSISNISAADSGIYTLTIMDSIGCTSATDSANVIVNALPATPVASSDSVVCEGQTLNLSTPAVSNMNYSWSGPNGFSSSVQNPAINPATTAAAGSYTVTLTDITTGCTSAPDSTTVTITPAPTAPTASDNGPICAGQTLSLSTPATSGMTYSWTGPNAFSSSLQNPDVSNAPAAASGTYSVTITDTATGCTSVAGTTTATVNPLPATPSVSSNSGVCLGQTLNLTGPTVSGASYAWTGPDSFSSALQNPAVNNVDSTVAGTYTLVLTYTATGCVSAPGSTSVTVKPLPATPTASSNSPVCAGDNLSLTASTATSGSGYTWSGPNGYTSSAQSPVITGISASGGGVYTVYAVLNGCQSDTAATISAVVNPTPVAAITAGGPLVFCAYDSVLLHANSGAGFSYLWHYNNTPVANAFDSLYTANLAGTYNVTVTNSNGCSTTSAPVSVTVNPVPASTITYTTPITFCEGGAVVLTAGSGTGYSYEWYLNNNPLPGANNNYYIAAQQGDYSVQTVSALGCMSVSQPLHITVNPLPNPVIVHNGNQLTTTQTYTSYQWFLNNNQGIVGSSPAIIPTQNGGYYVTVTDSLGCSNTSPVFFLNTLGIGQPSELAAQIKIYPNPVKQIVYIDAPLNIDVTIRDLTGRVIITQKNARQIDLGDVADGIYMMQLSDQEGHIISTQKLYKVQ